MEITIDFALRTAKEYYTVKGFDHALRVAAYVEENTMIPQHQKELSYCLAIMHDLLEDTKFLANTISADYFKECLKLITKDKNTDYISYIKKIKQFAVSYPEVYWVKMADMKDHLSLKETLTDKLKDKYLNALSELL